MSAHAFDENTSGMGREALVPDDVKGWSWAGFGLNWIWAIFNNVWIGLLVFVPYVGFIMCFVLGFKGREWAWRNKRWESLEHFNEVQKKWTRVTVWVFLCTLLGGALFIVLLVTSGASFVTR